MGRDTCWPCLCPQSPTWWRVFTRWMGVTHVDPVCTLRALRDDGSSRGEGAWHMLTLSVPSEPYMMTGVRGVKGRDTCWPCLCPQSPTWWWVFAGWARSWRRWRIRAFLALMTAVSVPSRRRRSGWRKMNGSSRSSLRTSSTMLSTTNGERTPSSHLTPPLSVHLRSLRAENIKLFASFRESDQICCFAKFAERPDFHVNR